MTVIPVILSGGSGTRLWPLSRANYPKQLLKLTSDYTMIQETMRRLEGMSVSSPIIVCSEQHRFIIGEQLAEINISNPTIILEPVARNTAPAIMAAALKARQIDKNAIIAVFPSDHVIKDVKAFQTAMTLAIKEAENGSLVTFGITPAFPATGYGYIHSLPSSSKVLPIKEFKEKPELKVAEVYVESFKKNGDYFWNSGMFVFKTETFISEISAFIPEINSATTLAFEKSTVDLDFIRLDKDSFEKNPSISIDYAVMEKTKLGKVVALDAGWSDVGSWSSLWDVNEKDENNNAIKGNVLAQNVKNSLIYGNSRTVAAIGLNDVVIVDTKDALLVAEKGHAEDVKEIVDKLKSQNNSCATSGTVGYRPWGSYDSIELGSRYRVKHITVKQGQKLSVQMHYHRAEHWIIVSGTAKVRNGEKEFVLTENQSTYIPVGTIHSIENPGKIPLEFIEVQSGAYLEEDDIVRFEDMYGR